MKIQIGKELKEEVLKRGTQIRNSEITELLEHLEELVEREIKKERKETNEGIEEKEEKPIITETLKKLFTTKWNLPPIITIGALILGIIIGISI